MAACSQDIEYISLEEWKEILSLMGHSLGKFGQEAQHKYSNFFFLHYSSNDMSKSPSKSNSICFQESVIVLAVLM